jgi:squalene synthase HpnC
MTAAAMQAPSRDVVSGRDLPPDYLVLGMAAGENFPVASRLLPAGVRSDLLSLYGWARLVDQLGDDYPGDRLAALDDVEDQLRCALAGRKPEGKDEVHPLVARMAETARRSALPTEPLFDLVQANRQDQAVSRYESFDELVAYCRLSANPVGRTVLAIFGYATPDRLAWSDSICTGLQLVEHWQDVAEDAIVGRVYLPMHDMRRFGVTVEELTPPPTSYVDRSRPGAPGGATFESRALMAFEVARARRWLDDGVPLVASLNGRLRMAVAAFVAGGHAALDALAARDFDIYADPSRPTPRRFVMHLVRLLSDANRGPKTDKAGPRGHDR